MEDFMVDSDLKSAVSARDLVKIRDFLGVRLQLDHNVFGMFTEGVAYCKANGISETDLYETHDGRNISVANTKENFNLLVGQLATNFSKERLEKTMEIAQAVWPEEQQQSEYVQQAVAGQQKSISDSEMHEVVREIPRKTPAANTEEYDSDGARIIRRGSTPTEEYDEDGNKILRKRTIIQNSGNEQHESKSSSTSGGIILAAVVLAAAAIIGAVLFLG